MRLVLLALLLIPSICFGGWSVKHVQSVVEGEAVEYSFFWDAESLTSAVDNSGTGVTLSGGSTGQFVSGVTGNAYDMDGAVTDSVVEFNVTAGDLIDLEVYTIDFDVQLGTIGDLAIFGFGGSNENVVLYQRSDGTLNFATERGGGGYENMYSTTTVTTGVWYHITVTMASNGDKTIYVDSTTPDSTTTMSGVFSGNITEPFYFGAGRTGIVGSDAQFDNFYIYPTVRPQQ